MPDAGTCSRRSWRIGRPPWAPSRARFRPRRDRQAHRRAAGHRSIADALDASETSHEETVHQWCEETTIARRCCSPLVGGHRDPHPDVIDTRANGLP